MKKILILASNPRQDLDLRYEIHVLKKIIEDCREREEFEVIIDETISPKNLQQLLLDHQPRIVHFCGHGSGANGLAFVDDAGKEQLVSTQALSNSFTAFVNTVECVLLNACYSEVQATAIVQHINYAIGMNQAIHDDTAIIFAKGFYQALGHGKTIKQCYELAKNQLVLELSNPSEQKRKFEVVDEREHIPIPEHLNPTIKVKSELTLFPEDIARQKYLLENQADFYLGQREQPSPSKQEYRHRQVLLNKVRNFWIEGEGVLEKALHTKNPVELKIQGRPDLVHNPSSEYQELPVDLNSSYEWLQASDIFEQMGDGRTLLILGKPGAGKTIALLKLAKRFIEKANNNLSLPIPVVFTLSSWASKRQPIDRWLIVELQEKYQVSKSLAKAWIEQEQLLLLLDGLDEVKTEHRNACVIALNKFLSSHSLTEIVVCSRFKEYSDLDEKLKLRSAIYIQPLTTEHISYYLRDAGEKLSGLKTLLRKDKEMEEFAKTPLILSIMSLTYKNYSSEDVLKQLSSPGNRYQNLFNSYIERMLRRKEIAQKYPDKEVLHWLSWLAKTMVDESQTVFLIEKMQPTLFQKSRREKISYQIWNFLLGGLSFGIMYALMYGLIDGLMLGLSGALIGQLIDGLMLGVIISLMGGLMGVLSFGLLYGLLFGLIGGVVGSLSQEITLFRQMSWSWQKATFRFLRKVLSFGLIGGLGGSFLCGLIVGLSRLNERLSFGLIDGLLYWLQYELLGGLIFGLIAAELIAGLSQEITLFEQISWSWQRATSRFLREVIIFGLIGGLLFGLIGGLDVELGLIVALSFGLIGGLLFGLKSGFSSTEFKERTSPNQGIWSSSKNSVRIGLMNGLSFGLIGGLLFGLIYSDLGLGLMNGMSFGLIGGLIGGLINGGATCIQHFNLRRILYRKGRIPWNYAKFLDYASERLLMKKVGGGYIFYHHMLMEHFAQRNSE